MVTYAGGPSPKRRRADAPATAQDVANTNRTLQAFTGARQNWWMELAERKESATPMAPASRGQDEGHEAWKNRDGTSERVKQVNRAVMADAAPVPPITSQQPRASSGNIREPINLVDYESPYSIDFSTNAQDRDERPKSVSRTMSQPGLPSPAPSIEVVQSHATTNTPDHQVSRTSMSSPRRGTGSRHSLGRSTTASATPAHTSVALVPATSSWALPGSYGQSSLTVPVSVLQSGSTQCMTTNSPLQYAQPSQGPPSRTPAKPDYFLPHYMYNHMEAFFASHTSRQNGYDDGRKMLLRDAVQANDVFYLVLSQIFCMRTTWPQHLPKLMNIVPSASFEALERLLCSNEDIDQGLVAFFAQFPAPVHLIYVSETCSQYLQHLEAVKSFLMRLPQTWPGMLEESRHLRTPPLAQDMAEHLLLTSPVLQLTAFRAIARNFWGDAHNRGLEILDHLHKIDQDSYFFRGWRRTEPEKRIARGVYASIFRSFREYCRQGRDPALYVPPPEISYISTPPPSMMRRSGSAVFQAEHVAVQQRQMMAANHARLSNQHHLPNQSQQTLNGSPPSARTPSAIVASQSPAARTSTAPTQLSRILPREYEPPRAQPVQPDTARMALHQAHLRSPAPGPKALPPGAQPLYRHVIGYAVNLTRINPRLHAQAIQFVIPEDDYAKTPVNLPSKLPGEPGKRHLDEFSYLYRLRCSRIPIDGFSNENMWVTADNVWPDSLAVDLNGRLLEPRRKLHHGRHLPIDLTPHLQPGNNVLNVFLARRTDETLPFEYALAVEIVGVKSHNGILSSIPTMSAADSLAAIKQSLASSSSDDDDDIVMTSNALTIGLFDPFTKSQICRIPVRGTACLHKDCFDLETFLSQCRREKPGYPTVVDCWRCPICKSDVRSQSMIKDGFLMDVRNELEKTGLLETRAIIVNEDGSWRPKPEEQGTGVRSASLEREEAAAIAQKATPKKAIEVIELD